MMTSVCSTMNRGHATARSVRGQVLDVRPWPLQRGCPCRSQAGSQVRPIGSGEAVCLPKQNLVSIRWFLSRWSGVLYGRYAGLFTGKPWRSWISSSASCVPPPLSNQSRIVCRTSIRELIASRYAEIGGGGMSTGKESTRTSKRT